MFTHRLPRKTHQFLKALKILFEKIVKNLTFPSQYAFYGGEEASF